MNLSGEEGPLEGPYLGELPGGSPETESGIAEVFELLRKKGMTDQEITVEIFKRDINADVKEIMKITGLDSMVIGRLKSPVSKKKKAKEAAEKEKKGEGGVPGGEEEGILKGEVDANRILEKILDHPDVPVKVRSDVMLLAEDTPGGIHPQALIGILLGYKGVSQNLANFVAMRYTMALTKATQEGKIQQWPANPSMMGMGQGPQSGWGGMGWGNQGWGQLPSSGPPPGFGGQQTMGPQPAWGGQPGYGQGYTERDVLRLRQDWDKEKKLENLERSVADLVKDLPNTIRNAMPQVEGQYEEVTEYIDKHGNLCGDPEKAFSLRSIRRPITSVPKASEDVKLLREEIKSLNDKIQSNQIKTLEDSIKRLEDKITDTKKPEESPEVRDLKSQLDQTRSSVTELRETMASKERETLVAKIDSLEDRISHYSTTAGEWKTDEAKLIASELGEIGGIVKEIAKKDRMGLIREIIIPESTQPPTEVAAGEGARGGVIDELRKHGFTARIIERQQ